MLAAEKNTEKGTESKLVFSCSPLVCSSAGMNVKESHIRMLFSLVSLIRRIMNIFIISNNTNC